MCVHVNLKALNSIKSQCKMTKTPVWNHICIAGSEIFQIRYDLMSYRRPGVIYIIYLITWIIIAFFDKIYINKYVNSH